MMKRNASHQPSATRLLVCGLFFAASAWLAAPQTAAADQQEYQQCMDDCRNTFGLTSCYANCEIFLNRAAPPPLPAVPLKFGAIAFDEDAFIAGSSKDMDSKAAAEKRALVMCRRAGGSAEGCEIISTGNNFCTALAASRQNDGSAGAWGYASSDDGWVARRDAMKECKGFGGAKCGIVVDFCTG